MEDEEVVDWTVVAAQKGVINKLMEKRPAKDETWYLVDCRWIKQWKRYVGYDHWDTGVVGDTGSNPGPVDNSFLLEADLRTLKQGLVEETDYTAMPVEAWDQLIAWYQLLPGQEPIKRHVIEQGLFVKRCKLEVYLLELRLCNSFRRNTIAVKCFSRAATVDSLVVFMRNVFHISQDRPARLWFRFMTYSYEQVTKWNNTLQDANLYPGQLVVIETQNNDGVFTGPMKIIPKVSLELTANAALKSGNSNNIAAKKPTQSTLRNHSNAPPNSQRNGYDVNRIRFAPGLCGLSNMGNTCFMNAALQCMSNVPSLTNYMLSDGWKDELNKTNLLGCGGDIAKTYAALIKSMWSGTINFVAPKDFKGAIGRFKPEFAGFQAQDSHELLAVLLDGLHEDLNRIKKKPYIEQKEANGRPDKEVASEVWVDYIQRNDSVIVDTFHGLLKSTIVCPQCEHVSVKFDPFGYLSLPLPVQTDRQVEVILVPYDPSDKLRRFNLSVGTSGTVSDLCIALSHKADISPEKMLVVEVYNNRFDRIFLPTHIVSEIATRDNIFIYEVPVDESGKNQLLLPVYMRSRAEGACGPTVRLFGPPCVLALEWKRCTYDVLYNALLHRMARYVGVMDVVGNRWKPFAGIDDQSDKDRMDVTEEASGDGAINMHDSESEAGGDSMDYKDGEDASNFVPHSKSSELFTLRTVNSYGTAKGRKVNRDGKPVEFFGAQPYIVAEWNSMTKNLFYDEIRALDICDDDSAKGSAFKNGVQLSDCLELFTSKEHLGAEDLSRKPDAKNTDDKWNCPSCKTPQKATKKFDLWQLPRVLVIHLKRFAFSRSWRDKLNLFVKFPIRNLNLQKWIINSEHQPAIYDLIAVTNHMGTLGGGHYTAFAKNKDTGLWSHFDDSNVRGIPEDRVVTQSGYVLVYQMRDTDPGEKAESSEGSGNPDEGAPMET